MAQVSRQEDRDAPKRHLQGCFNSEDGGPSEIDGTNAAHIASILDDLKSEFQQRLDSLAADLTQSKNKQQQAYASGMVKLPKSIKSMKVSEFNALYKIDLIRAVRRVREDHPIVSKNRDRLATATPEPTRRNNRPIETPSRTVRRGEALYSQNGSPLDAAEQGALVATVTKKNRGNAALSSAASFDFCVGEGKYVTLGDPSNMKDLDSELKNSALSQLKLMQDQIAIAMKQLE
ncbi:predicted protein [Phaeodactylum tricornutum CCAP 1055/1]|jgi:hypothetical protein|uniref:Borealin N-terminal domain-containing protein n=1 Tax=Phaeodactylum tricornutum (strain CCAP 1055/1) TaxID=556484 RepID=B7G111_PHATC|nr:predicted protein [Phaeodactylum tricornutum CCAP 1055/1]EEC47609.1 predicted protein [Phaeodactylum tricornutum CCAP 1055/1]|eukprot:XP_002180957.1 predicted protein [Phaeodactylum tricornutum CCAP 1055/1]